MQRDFVECPKTPLLRDSIDIDDAADLSPMLLTVLVKVTFQDVTITFDTLFMGQYVQPDRSQTYPSLRRS